MPEYTKYYGLSAVPFEDSPDPRFFFSSETHTEALASLTYGINQRKGFILILGDEGVGKTAAVQNLINTLDDKVKAVYIDQGHTSFEHMLKDLLGKLGLTSKRQTKGMMFHELYDFLIQCLERNENVVVFIDDAHKVSLETVEELRLMSNLETSKSKLLQIVLLGRPELNEKLSSELIRQIKQRIVIRNSIRPLTSAESLQYIDHRLRVAGKSSQAVFDQDALSLISKYSEGIPRIINRLCHNAMAAGCRRGEKMISGKTVKKIRHIRDFLSDEQARQFKSSAAFAFPVKYVFAIFFVIIIGGVLFFFRDHITGIFGGLHKTNSTTESSAANKSAKANTTRGDTAVTDSNPKNVSDINESKTQAAASRMATTCDVMPEHPIKKVIMVKRGLSLSLLALQYYNEANIMLIDYILELNPEINDLNLIQINQKIKLPDISGVQFLIQASNNLCNVHLETFANPNEALQYKRQVAIKGRNIEIVPRKVSPRDTWYRVLAGPFPNKENAIQLIAELNKSGLAPSLQRLSYSGR